KVWVRGYITLMLVDATVYSTLFYFLDVPYCLILGALAGCGILLPYIGPILSFSLTMLVTLATGDSSGAQLAGIIACYLIYNGIVEQFILYPAVIGESLGLTTLETIIVVLLGAIFAGIPGMILALPAASVVKYLVPRIYNCWNPVSKRNSSQ
ncbi:MAG: AI-2E family transporter, partial [Lentisphaeria bacterium]|nr:AI-2E family transporter [Lentisphaeria bacterium]